MGNVVKENYSNTHPVYTSMGRNAEKLMDDSDDIWSEGLYYFKKAMDATFKSKIFNPTVDASNNEGTILQIVFVEAGDSSTFSSPQIRRTGRIRFSKFLVFVVAGFDSAFRY